MKLKNSLLKLVNKQRRTCVIFNFHDIVADDCPVRLDQLTVSTFRQQLRWIQQHFQVVRIDQLIELYQADAVTAPMAAISFDDGYRAHYSLVKPILDEFGLKAAFYVSSAHLEKDYYWHDMVETFCQVSSSDQLKQLRDALSHFNSYNPYSLVESIKYLPLVDRELVLKAMTDIAQPLIQNRLLMNSEEALALAAAGHLVGGHTLNHPILALESDESCRHEIHDDLLALEQLLKQKIISFAYPNGIPERDFNRKHQQILADYGVKFAVNTHKSVLTKPLDPLSIPRINLFGSSESLHCNYLLRMVLKSIFRVN